MPVTEELVLLPTATRCGTCHARIRWVINRRRRFFPINAEPDPDGRYMLDLIDGNWVAERRRGYRALALRTAGHELYSLHICELE